MGAPISINFLDLSLSLSETLDFVSPLLAQHQVRTAYIAWRIGKEYQLPTSALEQVVFASLLHDVGALTPNEKIGLHESDYDKNIHIHCVYGEKILERAEKFKMPARIIRFHHKKWQEWEQKTPSETSLLAQIVFLADEIERAIDRDAYILHQQERITKEIMNLSGTSFYPEITAAFRAIAEPDYFWFECTSPSLPSILRQNAPGKDAKIYQAEFLEISEVIKKLVDFRSHFTATHSTGVSSSATLLASILGYSEEEIEMIEFAANLHDVGKLAISNLILEKNTRLTPEEFATMKEHAYHTLSFMRRCGLPEYLVEWAGYHHEKLNGTGYPLHKRGEEISHGARIISVADVLTALIEDRPYRKGMGQKGVFSILNGLVKAEHMDGDIVHTLKKHYAEIVEPTLQKQRTFSTQYKQEAEYLE